ncbi:MAG: M28 family metallopeptidase [Phascolarctobacterium sp.]|nr:M28 family metallopeptidase [Phascolarctobacterium sp.]
MQEALLTINEQELVKQVSADTLMEYDCGIAQYIRNSGTEEELKAFKYIEKVLNDNGIETILTFSDGYISLPISATVEVNGVSFECLTHSMSTSVENLSAEVIYAGKGKPNDMANIAAKGKILVIEGLAMGSPIKLAENAGAVGCIFLNDEHIHNMIGSCIWGSPSVEDVDTLPKIPFLSVNSESAAKIRAMLQAGQAKASMTTVVETKWRKLPTLEGNIVSSVEPDKYLLLSNHVDSWIYGAMDNGTANAALMHVVCILNKMKDQLNRSLKICFWSGHSHGRYAGSTYYCDAHYEDLYENCCLHVNADSLGGRGSDILTEANCMAETKDLAVPVIKAITGQDYNGSRYGRAGDQSFWGTGTPSLFMGLSEQPIGEGTAAKSFAELMGNGKTGGFGWWWHSSEDTVDKIDPQALARDCKVYLLVLYRALTEAYLPINQAKAARDIQIIISKYEEKVAGKINLDLIKARATQLADACEMLEQQKENMTPKDYNSYVMEMSRVLVPLNYVEESVFEHDKAVRGNDMPVLSVLDKYQDVEIDTDAWRLVNVVAVRRVNAVAFALKQAINIVKKYL